MGMDPQPNRFLTSIAIMRFRSPPTLNALVDFLDSWMAGSSIIDLYATHDLVIGCVDVENSHDATHRYTRNQREARGGRIRY